MSGVFSYAMASLGKIFGQENSDHLTTDDVIDMCRLFENPLGPTKWDAEKVSDFYIIKSPNGVKKWIEIVSKREDDASRKIQNWWVEILLNPRHPVGKDYLRRKAVEVCNY